MSCTTGKKPLDYERAQKLARKSSASHSHPMTAYKCTACGWWHLGQPAKRSIFIDEMTGDLAAHGSQK